MIYFKQTDPADAKPGDFTILRNDEDKLIDLKMCMNVVSLNSNVWKTIHVFYDNDYPGEIIDGKPTPALIARFSQDGAGESGGKFEMDGTIYLKKPWGIVEVPPVHSEYVSEKDGYEWHVKATGINTKVFGAASVARCERERLIAWLEGA